MLVPFRCPVCEGKGIVPQGFYDNITGMGSWGCAITEKCRACDGKGIIYSFALDPVWPIAQQTQPFTPIPECDHSWEYHQDATSPYRRCVKCYKWEPLPIGSGVKFHCGDEKFVEIK